MEIMLRTVFICAFSWNFFANGFHVDLQFPESGGEAIVVGSVPYEKQNTVNSNSSTLAIPQQAMLTEAVTEYTPQEPDHSYGYNTRAVDEPEKKSIDYALSVSNNTDSQGSRGSNNGDNVTEVSLTISPTTDSEQPEDDDQPSEDENWEQQQPQESFKNTIPEKDQGPSTDIGNSQAQIQEEEVTVSQILYHLNEKYEKMYKEQGENGQNTEVLETFLSKMLKVSETSTTAKVQYNKNVVSTTYAAYYSTEYAYTFALCKLHHLTKDPEDGNSKMSLKNSSQCSEVVEKFNTISTLYEQVVTATENSEEQGLKNGNETGHKNDQKDFKFQDEVVQNSNASKALHGCNDDNCYIRSKTEDNDTDKYIIQSRQQIGNSTRSSETEGQTNTFSLLLDSDTYTNPKNGKQEKSLEKTSTITQRTEKEKNKQRIENDQFVVDSNYLSDYAGSEKNLDVLARNYDGMNNEDIGGNIPNATSQVQEEHYTSVVEEIRDLNEEVRKTKPLASDQPKYTFRQAVKTLISYIRTVKAFVSTMEKNVQERKSSTVNGQKTDIYTDMHTSVHEETKTDRIYLRKYFTNYINVGKGTFSQDTQVDMQIETSIVETTVQRYSWLMSEEVQKQTAARGGKELQNNPLKLLWYFEEASYYFEYLKSTKIDATFMSNIPYPDFTVEINHDEENEVNIIFSIN